MRRKQVVGSPGIQQVNTVCLQHFNNYGINVEYGATSLKCHLINETTYSKEQHSSEVRLHDMFYDTICQVECFSILIITFIRTQFPCP